jgi:hypothetical protein
VTQYQLYRTVVDRKLSTRELHSRVEACLAPPQPREPKVSKSTLVLESGVRVTVALDKYTLRVPRKPGDSVDLPRLVADLERVVAELKTRL